VTAPPASVARKSRPSAEEYRKDYDYVTRFMIVVKVPDALPVPFPLNSSGGWKVRKENLEIYRREQRDEKHGQFIRENYNKEAVVVL